MFKKLLASALLIIFSSLFPSYVTAQESWTITEFNSDITLSQDTSLTVTETITADFGMLEKHGIYRTIPIRYQTPRGNTLDVRFQLSSVVNEFDRKIPYDVNKSGDYITIKIGDPDKIVSGINTYKITYTLKRVLTKQLDTAELTWNVTGHDWPVPILKATTTIRAPESSINRTICFTGYFGSTLQNCTHGHDGFKAEYTSTTIEPGEGFTVAVAVNPSFFTFPNSADELIWFLSDNWPYGLPLLTFLIISFIYYRHGRDQIYTNIFNDRGSVSRASLFARTNALLTYSPPKDLTPGEVGTLIDERVQTQDLTATIIDLARKGIITIKESAPKGIIFKKPEFTLNYHDRPEIALANYEKSVLDMLFTKSRNESVNLNKLPASAYIYLDQAQKDLYEHLTDKGYFLGNPNTVRGVYLGVGLAISIGGAFFAAPILATITSTASSYVGLILSGLIVAASSPFMPARSAKGSKALQEVVGLKEWINIGAWREKIHEKNNFFEEVLPFAIAFGLTEKFIKALEGANIKPPSWYKGTGSFNMIHFNNSLNTFDNSLTSGVAATRPKSSSGSSFGGGGSSGGGFGGGGGGSW